MIGCEGIKGKKLCNIWKHRSCAGNKNLKGNQNLRLEESK